MAARLAILARLPQVRNEKSTEPANPPFPRLAAGPRRPILRQCRASSSPWEILPESARRSSTSLSPHRSIPAGFDIEILGDRNAGIPGKPDARSAAAALAALQEAVRRLKNGTADAVVTGPVSKEGLQSVGFPFPGQTEFFADAFGVADYGMLLTGATLTVGLATIHEPLAKVPELLTEERIIRIGLLTAAFPANAAASANRASPWPD